MAAGPPIKGIIFDLDNTLFRCGPRYYDYYALTAATAAINLGLKRDLPHLVATLQLSGAASGNDGVAQFAVRHGLPARQLVHEFNAVAGRMFGDLLKDPGYAEPLPGLPALLARTKLPMAVVTRGPRAWAEPVIAQLGLSESFAPAALFTSDRAEIGDWRSRDGLLFIAGWLGVPPPNIAEVDDVAENLIAAAALDMRTVLVDWGQPAAEILPCVQRRVADVRDFLHALDGP